MKKLAKSAIIVIILQIISKALGLLREIILAKQFGTSYIVDAYTIAISLPSVIFAIYASGFSNSYLPIYSYISEDSKKNRLFSNTLTILVIISILISIFVFAFSGVVLEVMAPGFEGEAAQLTESFIKIIAFIFPFMTIFSMFEAQAGCCESFEFSYFVDFIVINIVIIVSMIISNENRVLVLPIGYVMSMVIAAVMIAVYVFGKKQVKYSFVVNLRDETFIELTKLALPLGVSLLVNQLNAVIDKVFSSSLGEGITSSLSYANRIQLLPYSLIVSVILTVCYPRMSKCFAEASVKKGMFYAEQSSLIALFIAIPVTLCLCFFSKPIIQLFFERGAFSAESTSITALCLAAYSIGIPFYALREIASKTLAANLKQKAILKNTIISVICNVVLDYFLVKLFGYAGLPLATSIAGLVSFCLMNIDLKKLNLHLLSNINTKVVLKMWVSALLSLIICKSVFYLLKESVGSNIAIVCGICGAVTIYIIVNLILKNEILLWGYKLVVKER